ncbi:MAG TPA: hypothetical protein VHU87_14375 [Rhizomicrobium sp.]|jgi:hypothetical protein|nr:hypothetical protein [Rhizomicrobium sp.]
MFRRIFIACLAFAALGLSGASAQRYAREPYGPRVVPLERMLPEIRRGYPGTFYDAEGPIFDEMGNPHYHIKWLTPQGRVIWLDTDARTGRVLGVNGSGWRTQQFRGGQVYGGGGWTYRTTPRYAPPPGWNHGGNFHGGGYAGGGHWSSGGPHGGNHRGH